MLTQKTVYQIGRSALSRTAGKESYRTSAKAATIAERKLLGQTASNATTRGAGVAVTNESAAVSRSSDVHKAKNMIKSWLGEEVKLFRNDAKDLVFLSKDGLRKVRFDFNKPAPHTSPHAHVEELFSGKWNKSGPIYPIDVPHF